jgi:hypothetical protein
MPHPSHPPWLDHHNKYPIVKRTSYEIPHYAVFSSILPLLPSWVYIFSLSTLLSDISIYAPPLAQEKKSRTHTKQ